MCGFRAAGKSLDNDRETFSGEIKIPNLSDENEMDDVDVSYCLPPCSCVSHGPGVHNIIPRVPLPPSPSLPLPLSPTLCSKNSGSLGMRLSVKTTSVSFPGFPVLQHSWEAPGNEARG